MPSLAERIQSKFTPDSSAIPQEGAMPYTDPAISPTPSAPKGSIAERLLSKVGSGVATPPPATIPAGPPTQEQLQAMDLEALKAQGGMNIQQGTLAHSEPSQAPISAGGIAEQIPRASETVAKGWLETLQDKIVNPVLRAAAIGAKALDLNRDATIERFGGAPTEGDLGSQFLMNAAAVNPPVVQAVQEDLAQNPPQNTPERVVRGVATPLVDPLTYAGGLGGKVVAAPVVNALEAQGLANTAKAAEAGITAAGSMMEHTAGQNASRPEILKSGAVGLLSGPFSIVPGFKGIVSEALGISGAQVALDLLDGTQLPKTAVEWAEYLGPNAVFATVAKTPGLIRERLKAKGIAEAEAAAAEAEIRAKLEQQTIQHNKELGFGDIKDTLPQQGIPANTATPEMQAEVAKAQANEINKRIEEHNKNLGYGKVTSSPTQQGIEANQPTAEMQTELANIQSNEVNKRIEEHNKDLGYGRATTSPAQSGIEANQPTPEMQSEVQKRQEGSIAERVQSKITQQGQTLGIVSGKGQVGTRPANTSIDLTAPRSKFDYMKATEAGVLTTEGLPQDAQRANSPAEVAPVDANRSETVTATETKGVTSNEKEAQVRSQAEVLTSVEKPAEVQTSAPPKVDETPVESPQGPSLASVEMTFKRARDLFAEVENERDVNKLKAFAEQHNLTHMVKNWDADPGQIAHGMASHLALRATLDAADALDALEHPMDKKQGPRKADSGLIDDLSFALEHAAKWTRDQVVQVAKRLGVAVRGTTQAIRTAVVNAMSKIRTQLEEESGMALLKNGPSKNPTPLTSKGKAADAKLSLTDKEKLTLAKNSISAVIRGARREVFSASADVESALRKAEKMSTGDVQKLIHEANTRFRLTTSASEVADSHSAKFYRDNLMDMSTGQLEALGKVMTANRVIELASNARRKGQAPPTGPMSVQEAKDYLDSLSPVDKKFLDGKADKWYEFNKDTLLPFAQENGLISEKQKQDLLKSGAKYFLRDYIDELDPTYDPVSGDKVLNNTDAMSVSDSGFKRITGSEYEKVVTNPVEIVNTTVSRIYNRAFKNRAAVALHDIAAVEKNPLGIKNVEPVPGKEIDFQPVFPPAPKRFKYIYSMKNGKRRATLVPEWFHEQFSIQHPDVSTLALNIVGVLSGSKARKFFTTGPGNPLWFISGFPMDIGYNKIVNPEWGTPVIGDARMAMDLIKAFPDALIKGKFYDRIHEEGGISESLSNLSRLSARGYGKLATAEKSLNFMNDFTQRWVKLAVARRVYENTGSYAEAAFRSKTAIDFLRGGRTTKLIESIKPWTNAMVAGLSGIAEGWRRSGGWSVSNRMLWASAQMLATGLALSLYNRAKNRKDVDETYPEEAVNNWIFYPGISYKDKDGKERKVYLKVRKDQYQRTLSGISEALIDAYEGDDKQAANDILTGLSAIASFNPEEWSTPTAQAFQSYVMNIQPYTYKKIWQGGNVPPSQEYTEKTNPLLVKMAAEMSKGGVEVSPDRAAEAFIQYFGRGFIPGAVDGLTTWLWDKDMPKEEQQALMDKMLTQIKDNLQLKGMIGFTDPDRPEYKKRDESAKTENALNLNTRRKLEKALDKNGRVDYSKLPKLRIDEYEAAADFIQEAARTADMPAYWKRLKNLEPAARKADIVSKLQRYEKTDAEQYKKFKDETMIYLGRVFGEKSSKELTEVFNQMMKGK